MVGTDTYSPERWHYVVEHASYSRTWLADLPADVADNIAYRNAERLAAVGIRANEPAAAQSRLRCLRLLARIRLPCLGACPDARAGLSRALRHAGCRDRLSLAARRAEGRPVLHHAT